jgi:hypothetical protein
MDSGIKWKKLKVKNLKIDKPRFMKLIPIFTASLALLIGVSCTILPAPAKQKYRISPTEKGVRTAGDGSAVIELSQPLEVVFEEVEGFLKETTTISMINRRTLKIDANSQSKFFAFDFMPLTTGKTGVIIWASEGPTAPLDPYMARQMGDKIVDFLNKPKKSDGALSLKVGEVDPRTESE